MTILQFALRNLLRRPARTLLLVLSIGLAVATALALLALSAGIQSAARQGVSERGADLTVSQRDASDVFSGFIDEALEPKIRAIAGVAGVAGELAMFAPVDGDNEFLVFGWSPDSYFWKDVPVADGKLPPQAERGFVLLGETVAKTLGKKAGNTISMFDRTIPIAAVTNYQAVVNRGMVVMPLADLQELAFRTGQVTLFNVLLERGLPAERVEAIKAEIVALGNVSVYPTEQFLSGDRNLEILQAVSRAISLIALTMAGLSVLNVLLMAVQERRREIGILMAIGWSRRRIVSTILAEGALTGILGSLAGIPLGMTAGLLFSRLPTIGNYIAFEFSPALVAPSVVAGLVLSLVGSFYPAWRAVSQTPADALRLG